jgi:acyl carrier protein
MTTTLERLQALLHGQFELPLAQLQPEVRLETLQIDSLRMLEVLFAAEDEFKITVSSDQAELKAKLHTIADLVGYIDTLLREQPGPAAAVEPAAP